MKEPLPKSVVSFKSKYPAMWDAFAALGEQCQGAGPLDEKSRRLIKLGIAIGSQHEGAVHSAARQALSGGTQPRSYSTRPSPRGAVSRQPSAISQLLKADR